MFCVHSFNYRFKSRLNPATEKELNSEFSESKEAFCDRCNKWFNRIWPLSQIYFLFIAKPKVICELCFIECQTNNDVHAREQAWWED